MSSQATGRGRAGHVYIYDYVVYMHVRVRVACAQEEEHLTNELQRKLVQLRQEKLELEKTLEREQQEHVSKLMRRIERLENDTLGALVSVSA